MELSPEALRQELKELTQLAKKQCLKQRIESLTLKSRAERLLDSEKAELQNLIRQFQTLKNFSENL